MEKENSLDFSFPQAMVFAAGIGSRLRPLTDTMPKALVKVSGVPMLERVIKLLKSSGIKKIVINVHHFSSQIKNFLKEKDNFGIEILLSDETSFLLDTGGGIKKARPLFTPNQPILIHNVDIISNVNLKELFKYHKSNDATLLVSKRKTNRYLLFDDDMNLCGWTNTQTGEVKSPYKNLRVSDCKMMAFSGIHILSQSLFPFMEDSKEKFSIIDFYLSLSDKVKIKGFFKEDLKLIDIGKQETLLKAEEFLKEL